MLKAIKWCVVVAVVLCAYGQQAQAREFADIYTECGLGAIIAPRNAAVAAVTNVTWDSGTTAISSNITTPDTCQGGKEKTAAFIYQSYPSLEKDLASGHGAYLDTLVLLTQGNGQSAEQFKQALRQGFTKLVAQENYTKLSLYEKSQALYNVVYQNQEAHS